jgi:osmotically-inducible protein OsmY
MAYDMEAGIGSDLPVGDRYYGPREWAGQGGGRDGDFERGYLRGTFEGSRSRYTGERYRGTDIDRVDNFLDQVPAWAAAAPDTVTGPYAGRGPLGYIRSERRIQEDVSEALTRDPDLDPSEVEVRVEGDEVTLEGTVDSRADRRHAEDLAAAVWGVWDVHNRLKVRTR